MATVTIRPPVDAADLDTVGTLVADERADTTARTEDVFPQSVASGGPTPSGAILWTRIAPDHYDPEKVLRLEVASDDSFAELVRRVELPGTGIKPTDNYTIRVDLAGYLEPNSAYFYRFGYGGVRSQIGRCRTLPAPDAAPESLRFGLLNCQNYQNGYYGAMAHLADTDVDFVLHLGDYVYEEVADGYPHGPDGPYKDRRFTLPDGKTLPMSVNDFRRIYETYKADPYLQRLHERHTVIQTWDDHAIANDRYWSYDDDAPVFPDHPCGRAAEFTRYLTRAGIQAWWEFIPARIGYDPAADHIQDSFDLYHAVRFGDLVTLLLTDERLYRSEPLSPPEKLSRRRRSDPSRTMLGPSQREWFLTNLRESDATWTVWANAVLFTPFTLGLRWLTLGRDSWDGFEAERRAILETLAAVRRADSTSFVTLTGDMHTTLATRICADDADGTPVGVEFMTPGATSVNVSEKIQAVVGGGITGRLAHKFAVERIQATLEALNRDYALLDSAHWGYSVIEFSRDACTWDVYWVDKTVNSDAAPREPVGRIRVPAGADALQLRRDRR